MLTGKQLGIPALVFLIGSSVQLCGLLPRSGGVATDAACESVALPLEAGLSSRTPSWFAQLQLSACAISPSESIAPAAAWKARYNLGISLAEKGETKRSVDAFRQAVEQKPQFLSGHLALGSVLHDLGDLPGAEMEFREALKLDPRSAAILHDLGVLLVQEKKYTVALRYLTQARDLEPQDMEHQAALAEALDGSARSEEAIAVLVNALTARPDSPLLQLALATLYARQSRYTEAIPHFQAAIHLDPADPLARLSLAKVFVTLGRLAEALQLLDEELQYRPHQAEAHYLRGVIYRQKSDNPAAIDNLRMAVLENPRDYDSQYFYGVVLAQAGKLAEARVHLEIAHSIEPKADGALFQLANVLRRLGDNHAAESDLREIEQHKRVLYNQEVAATETNQANGLLKKADPVQAIRGYEKALELDPDNAIIRYDLGLARLRNGDAIAAMDAFQRSIALDPHYTAAHNQLGLLYLQARRMPEAAEQFRAAILSDPQCSECQDNLGVLSMQTGDSRAAESLFRQAIESEPADPRPRINLALALAGRSDFTGAREQLDTILATDPRNIQALTTLGAIQKSLHISAAVETFKHITELAPQSAEAHLNLGMALLDQHKAEAALEEFSKAALLSPNAAAPRYQRGLLLDELQRYDEAHADLTAAYRLAQGDPDIREALRRNEEEIQQRRH